MVNSIVTGSDIILYWDIFDKKTDNDKYFIFLNGTLAHTTERTHVTLRGIEGASAKVEIYLDEKNTALFYEADLDMKPPKRVINVADAPYLAVGDGKTLNTRAIQAAIDDCAAGECVLIPEGVFLTGALKLHDDMELCVTGELRGSEDPEDYLPRIWTRFEGNEMECYSSLINIGNIENRDEISAKNILIHGGGKIFGGGYNLAVNVLNSERARLEADPDFKYDPECENNNTLPGRVRPKLINVSCAENVVIEGLDLGYGSCWNLHMIYSKNIVTANCGFYSREVWNGDGWDPDSSEDCTIFNCHFHTGDDCIAIKSGKNPEGSAIAKPTRNVKVFDCNAEFGHSIAIGSEMSGGVSDVYIWDCDFSRTFFGFEIKGTKKRGGYVKNIFMKDSKITRIMMHAVLYNDDGIAAPTVPYFGDCKFENITICPEAFDHRTEETTHYPIITLTGFDEEHKIENIVFENITVDSGKDGVEQTISLETLKNITIKGLNVR